MICIIQGLPKQQITLLQGYNQPMKKFLHAILPAGDNVWLMLIGLLVLSSRARPARPWFDLLTSVPLLLLIWWILDAKIKTRDFTKSFWQLGLRLLITWGIAGSIAWGFRAAALWFIYQDDLSLRFFVGFMAVGAILLLGWRTAYWGLYRLLHANRSLYRVSGWVIIFAMLISLAAVSLPRVVAIIRHAPEIQPVETIAPAKWGIVFGAAVYPDNRASAVVQDRVQTAVNLYKAGKVDMLLLSGDGRTDTYNEPAVMRSLAERLGVPSDRLVVDESGLSTFESCSNAIQQFNIHEAILVTQRFQLIRALYLCNEMGVKSSGAEANLRQYAFSSLLIWNIRDVAATAWDWWTLYKTRASY